MDPLLLIAKKYSIGQLLGKGKFGAVYNGIYEKTGHLVAIKLESKTTPYKLLKQEATILKYLYDHGSRVVPIVYWYGIWNEHTCLVMPLYDTSLCDRGAGSEDAIMIACISILQDIHSHQVLHCDIKPDHFMLSERELFLVDFGLATFYDPSPPDRAHQHLLGSPKYASYFLHLGEHPGYRDDLLSLGYMYYYRVYGSAVLPECSDERSEIEETDLLYPKNQVWKTWKSWTHLRTLVQGEKIESYFSYCYRLTRTSVPDYAALKTIFSRQFP
jgi:serine/threonine protein kinase